MSRCVTRPTRIFAGPDSLLRRSPAESVSLLLRSCLASTAAQAQYTIEYGGRTIRIDPDRGTVSIPGVYDNTGRPSKRSRTEDNDRSSNPAAGQDRSKTDPKTDTQTAPAAAPAPAPAEQAAALCRPGASSRPLQQRPNRRPRPLRPPIYRDRSACSTGFAGYRAASGKTCAGSSCRQRPLRHQHLHLHLPPFRPPTRRSAFG